MTRCHFYSVLTPLAQAEAMKGLALLLALGLSPLAHDQMNMPGMNHTVTADTSLQNLNGKDFDRAFLSMMIVHH